MLTIKPKRKQWAGWKVYLNLRYMSLQSGDMVVIQTMARTNQGVFHLVVSQTVYSSSWHSVVYSNVEVDRVRV